MRRYVVLIGWLPLASIGCSPLDTSHEVAAEVRRAFSQLQDAIERDDLDSLWDQFDESTHQAAERRASEARDAFAKASPKERAAQAKEMELEEDEIPRVNAQQMLRTPRFRELYQHIPYVTVAAVELSGDSATVWYRAEDGEEEPVVFHREQGRWKAAMPVQ